MKISGMSFLIGQSGFKILPNMYLINRAVFCQRVGISPILVTLVGVDVPDRALALE